MIPLTRSIDTLVINVSLDLAFSKRLSGRRQSSAGILSNGSTFRPDATLIAAASGAARESLIPAAAEIFRNMAAAWPKANAAFEPASWVSEWNSNSVS